ncbi:hypothetical protein [Rhodococcus koreensis]
MQLGELDAVIRDVARAEQPLTVRGAFYRVMSRGAVPKTETGYRTVQRRILIMRRDGRLPYSWIADGTRWQVKPQSWRNVEEALENTAQTYRRQLWNAQGIHLEVWSEKDAITSVVSTITEQWDVPLMVARGFSSETFLWNTAQDIIADDIPAVIYQLGDHDPSGVAAWQHTQDKLTEFAPDVDFTFERLAVTEDQIYEFELPTRPTKTSDTRAAAFIGESVEVDAIPSTVLRGLVRDAIEQWVDPQQLAATEAAEASERDILWNLRQQLDDRGGDT